MAGVLPLTGLANWSTFGWPARVFPETAPRVRVANTVAEYRDDLREFLHILYAFRRGDGVPSGVLVRSLWSSCLRVYQASKRLRSGLPRRQWMTWFQIPNATKKSPPSNQMIAARAVAVSSLKS